MTLDAGDLQRLAQGLPVSAPQVTPQRQYAVLREDGRLAAVGAGNSRGQVRPLINLGV